MKNFSTELLDFLMSDATDSAFLFTLFYIQLPNGQLLTATNAPTNLVWSGVTYYATQYGTWNKDTVTIEIGTGSNSCKVTVLADSTHYMPGSTIPLLQAMAGQLFNGAAITIYTAYMNTGDFGNIIGTEVDFVGQMGKIEAIGRSSCTFDVNDLMYRLNYQMPRNLLQSNCRHTLFDAGCTLNATAYESFFAVEAGSTQLLINTTTAFPAVPYYSQGFIKMTSGQNSGLSMMIKQQNSTYQIQLMKPFLFPINVGDSFAIYPGCDKTLATCTTKFANEIHFGAFPFVPNPESVI